MKKLISFVLALFCVIGLFGCNSKADFDDFSDYEADFVAIKNFLVDFNFWMMLQKLFEIIPQVILQRKNSAKRLKLYPQKKGLKCGLVS